MDPSAHADPPWHPGGRLKLALPPYLHLCPEESAGAVGPRGHFSDLGRGGGGPPLKKGWVSYTEKGSEGGWRQSKDSPYHTHLPDHSLNQDLLPLSKAPGSE